MSNEEDISGIVQDLGDEGRNVSQWHWEEKDSLPLVKKRLQQLFDNLIIFDKTKILIKIISLKEVKGECTFAIRKGKLKSFYELKDLKLNWIAQMKSNEEIEDEIKGNIMIPYIGDENEVDDFEVKIFLNEGQKMNEKRERLFRLVQRGETVIRKKIIQFINELKTGENIVSQKPMNDKPVKQEETSKSVKHEEMNKPMNQPVKQEMNKPIKETKPKIEMRKIVITETFNTIPEIIYQCFIDDRRVSAYTRSKAVIKQEEGGHFSLHNDSVEGITVKLIPNRQIVQKWRFKNNWPIENHYSNLTITLEERELGKTIMTLHHSDIPDKDSFGNDIIQRIEMGWRENYIKRIRLCFGY